MRIIKTKIMWFKPFGTEVMTLEKAQACRALGKPTPTWSE